MSDKVEKNTPASGDSRDRVGDILRKERITRRITVETIAKDLKLNVNYIKALEDSDYSSLPADPYVRVYLRSLAKYLSLDSDQILSEFYKERGLEQEHYQKDTSNKLEISMQKAEPRKSSTFLITSVLVLLIGVLAYVANQNGWIPKKDQVQTEIPAEPVTAKDTLVDEDSLLTTLATPVSDSLTESDTSEAAVAKEVEKTEDSERTTPMNLQLQIVKDSAWIQVFSDGESWKNILREGQVRNFSAKDSFNIKLGSNQATKIKLDGEPINVRGRGVVVFKLDRSGADVWNQTKWNRTFRDRQ
ncbi:MAG: helix-turn-helix domain-containing protein [Fibrobacterota bacterium]